MEMTMATNRHDLSGILIHREQSAAITSTLALEHTTYRMLVHEVFGLFYIAFGHSLPPRLRDAAARGRVGVLVTRIELEPDPRVGSTGTQLERINGDATRFAGILLTQNPLRRSGRVRSGPGRSHPAGRRPGGSAGRSGPGEPPGGPAPGSTSSGAAPSRGE
jgi:hypothetical protein